MADQALYRKWRPAAFDEVVGQEHVIKTIQNALASGRAAHAYLFSGPRGTGKTTTARLVAKALNCLHSDPHQRPDNTCPNCLAVNEGRFLDLIEIDAASNTGVDNIRDLRDKINFSPSEGQYKIYIIDEVHMLSMGAFNALLKTLEEPPPHAIFILATTELHKVPLTVASRCQKHTFRHIPAAEVARRLQEIVTNEKLTVEPAVLELVARQATGSLRDAISLLDQLVIAPDEPVTLDNALAVLGTASGQAVQDLITAIADNDSARGLDLINAALDAGTDPRQFARQMVDYLRGLLLIRLGNAALVESSVGPETRKAMQTQAARFEPAKLLGAIKAFNTASDQRGTWISQLPLELAFVECLRSASQMEPVVVAAPRVEASPAVKAPPPPSPVSPAQPSPSPAQPAIQLGALLNKWKQVVTASKSHHPNLPPLLDKCNPISIEGDVVTLGFQNDILLSKANDSKQQIGIEKTLAKVFGVPLKVKCIVNSIEVSLPPDVDSNGIVAEGVKLGGKLRKQ
ncbi:MAG TPA: DNA polymerase III subunit gamma/tau [Anaerolineales bacterium]|nr:DNA polymerase III subunit gamma/tau [Anaerolineales bacterium]